jgi:hypothetical protein
MAKKPKIILEIKTYADGVLVDRTVKVIERGPDWIRGIILVIVIPWGFWLMTMGGMFG